MPADRSPAALSPAGITTARDGLLRVYAHAACEQGRPHLSDLRVMLVTDVLLRTARLSGVQVVAGLGLPDIPQDQVKALARSADRLDIHPPAVQVGTRDIRSALGGPADAHVVGHAVLLDPSLEGIRITVGPARAPVPTEGGASRAGDPLGGVADPLAFRLALLDLPHEAPADLSAQTLAEAQQTLAHWRHRVAGWANAPSKPVHAEITRVAHSYYTEGLDTASVLDLLRQLDADDDVSDGSRFETFLHLDRVLGLELPAEIGHPPAPGSGGQ